MSIRNSAWLFAVILLLLGILGFIPAVAPDGYLFGIFEVDLVHNIIHLASGLLFAWAAATSASAARSTFKIFGVVYGLVMVIGFVQQDTILGLFTVNQADNLLHLLITASAFLIAYTGSDR